MNFDESSIGPLLNTVVKLVAYIAPFFLIPATFKVGMGVFGNLAGMVNDRGRGIFDRNKKYRANKRAEGINNFKSGTGTGRVRQSALVRRAGTGVGAGFKGRYGFGERGAQARSQITGLAASEQVMKNPRWSQINENDDALHALTYNSANDARQGLQQRFRQEIGQSQINEKIRQASLAGRTLSQAQATEELNNEADKRAERAVAAAGASVGYGRSQAVAAAQQLATTGTGYTDLTDQAETIARASGGDKNTIGAIAGYNNYVSKTKGRNDLAPGAGNLIGISTNALTQSTNDTRMEAESMTESAWNTGSLYTLANAKGKAVKSFSAHWERQLQEGLATGDTEKIRKARTAFHEMRAMVPNSTGENASILNESIARMDIATRNYQESTGPVVGASGGARTSLDFDNIDRAASTQARTYQRPDEATMG